MAVDKGTVEPSVCKECGAGVVEVHDSEGRFHKFDIVASGIYMLADVEGQVVVREAPAQFYVSHISRCEDYQNRRTLQNMRRRK